MKSKKRRQARHVSRTLTERELGKTIGGINPQPEPPGIWLDVINQINQITNIPQLH